MNLFCIDRTIKISPFMSGFFHLAECFQGSSYSCLDQNCIPFKGGITLSPRYVITSCLSTRVSIGIWPFPPTQSLWITGIPLYKCVFPFLLWDGCLGTGLMAHFLKNFLRRNCPARHSGCIVYIHTMDAHSFRLFLELHQHLISIFVPIPMKHFLPFAWL